MINNRGGPGFGCTGSKGRSRGDPYIGRSRRSRAPCILTIRLIICCLIDSFNRYGDGICLWNWSILSGNKPICQMTDQRRSRNIWNEHDWKITNRNDNKLRANRRSTKLIPSDLEKQIVNRWKIETWILKILRPSAVLRFFCGSFH